ncbi:MAG: MlaD family protein, partial [Pseudomonadota bacterium]|nr:MlaD family protein [Pseudomonadota bacterium]
MKIRANEFKVGIFVIFALAVLVAIVRFLSPETFRSSSYKRYHFIAANAEGVVDKTHVRTNGVTVGKVLALELLDNETKITFGVEEDIFIPIGSEVEIRSRGLLGDKFIEVLRSDSKEEAEIGSQLSMSSSGLDMDKMMTMASDIATDVKRITSVLADGFDTPAGEQGVDNLIKDLAITLSELKMMIKDNRVRVGGTLTHLERASRNIADVMEKHGSKFDVIITDLEQVSGALRTVFDNKSGSDIVGIMSGIDAAVEDIKHTTSNIRLVSEQIQSGKGSFGRLLGDDGVINKVEETID